MSLVIESLDDVRNLVRRLGIKVNTIEELKDLLTAIKAQNDPEATRNRVIKHIATLGICMPFFLATVVLGGLILAPLQHSYFEFTPGFYLAAFGIVWGVAGLISLVSLLLVIFGLSRRSANQDELSALMSHRRPTTMV